MERRRSQSRSYETETEAPHPVARHPEHRLWFHVLRRQIWDYVLYRDAKQGTEDYCLAEDAAGWIWWDGEEDIDDCGRPTYRYICKILNIDHRKMREAALRLTRDEITVLNNQLKEE